MFELVENYTPSAEIKVIGVGGGGGNAVAQMIDANIDGVEFIAANTDSQALRQFKGKTALQIGSSITKGLGAGANPEIGRQAALEDRDHIIEILKGADMVFITAGMGGGTGTGAAPVIAQAAKEMGILTVAVVTKPFHFEARRRMAIAEQGIEELSRQVDSLITIPNAKLFEVMGDEALLLNAFKAANDVLQGAVQGIAELITRQGLINVDFADVRTVMSEMGMAVMGAGYAQGQDRAIMAVQSAIGSPLLDDVNLSGARGVLVNITAGMNLTMKEFDEVGSAVADLASDDATVVIGTVIDPDIGDELRVTVVATGLGEQRRSQGHENNLQVVRNATTGEPEPGYGEPGMASRATPEKGEAESDESKTGDMFTRQEDIDYLDIPSFLRIQAD
ncbi:MAG: cell division protein FtsZ [Xanthomonadales bacterium]|nr:cell division protein FtsZ [Xanthomonadales bacterium]